MEIVKSLTAAEILASEDLKPIRVDVPEWGGCVYIRPISAAESLLFVNSKSDPGDSAVRLLVLSVTDELGNAIFTEGDLPKVKAKSFKVVMHIQEEALKLNGLSGAAEKLLAKNV